MSVRPCNPLPARDLAEVVVALHELWPRLDRARIFVTGGSGFFGVWLLETYLAARDRYGIDTSAVVLTRDVAAFETRLPHIAGHPAIELIEGDVRSFRFPDGELPFLVHGATEASATLNEERPQEMFDTIVDGTNRVLDFAVQAGTRRFLLTSSGAVYGTQSPDVELVAEDDPQVPMTTTYGEGKRVAELHCAVYAQRHRALQPLITRGFAFVGPHLPLDRHFAIGNFIRDALAGRTIEISGDGTPLRSYLYASDLAIWLWTILFRGEAMRPYNVGSENAVSIAGLAARVAASVTPSPLVHIARSADPARKPSRYVPSTFRAREELGLRESVALEEAIARTIAWHRA